MSTRSSSRKTSLNSKYYNKDFVTDLSICDIADMSVAGQSADTESNVEIGQEEAKDDVVHVEATREKQTTLVERSERHKANLAWREELKDQLAAAWRIASPTSTSRHRQL